ncbi:MAG: Mrp/NBP35 family ATP-binding protein, partial [Bacteroidales bacterium]|nr:Mrp/NBP35 family ATP-binding protein [Bacteroidales bacterium]
MRKKNINGVKHLVVVASGKGGVGKSTVASNLAIMLARKGYKTALVDADIYGPSIPRIFGVEDEKIRAYMRGEEEVMMPVEKYGVKLMSIGMLVDPRQAVIWRGPLAANALGMMLSNTEWGDIDYLVIDFPPGTGDIQISMMQQYRISAAI